MKISSKSILSPGRPRDPPASLSISLSRKLRNSRSIKGGASPAMFPATGKRRASGFDNPEPSSPKVTCIGQVRVKTKKKHAKNFRTLSRRHSTGEVGFRKLHHSGDGFSSQECLPEQRNNQRWVHLPLTICEALREFSCLFPCRSSCSSTTTGTEKEEKTAAGSVDGNRQGSCGAVFARWLVALHDGDEGGRVTGAGAGETELVAGDDDEEDEDEEMSVRNERRHVFEDLEIVNDCIIQGGKDEGRVSICVPPKNALLLMRCRSDPMKMEALTNRSWEPSVGKNEEEDEDFVHEIEENRVPQDLQLQKVMDLDEIHEVNNQQHHDLQEASIDQENMETNLEAEMKQSIQEQDQEQSKETNEEEEQEYQEQSIEINEEEEEEEEESMYLWSLFEENAEEDQEFQENDEAESDMEDAREELFEEDEDVEKIKAEESSNIEKIEDFEEKNEEQMATEFTDRSETPEETREEVVMELKEVENGVLERESEVKEERQSSSSSSSRVLPECLLLMMCEPKLSMEVSKETWVCGTDFIRQHSGRKKPPPLPRVKSVNDQTESKVNTTTLSMAAAQYEPELHQPARSSCSLPAPPSMAAMVEQKLVGYEPFVLTRCKSEPMRTAAAKLVPESCFWKNRKLEPLGIGVVGLGF